MSPVGSARPQAWAQGSMSAIFISYRRNDSPDAAGRLYDRLVAEFGKARVFKDVDSIPLGQDFRAHLDEVLAGCSAVLAIIGPRWIDARDSAGQRRLEDPEDFVRVEIEAALARKVPVVPVLVSHAAVPIARELPASLVSLAYRQAIEVRPDPDFHGDATRLVAALRGMLAPSPPVDAPRSAAPRSAAPGASWWRRPWIAAGVGAAVLATVGLVALPNLRKAEPERVVVLDFQQRAAEPEDFSRGLGERIRAALAASQVQTLAQADASEFRGAGITESARRHGVSFLLDGSVQREGDQLRVGMQLSDARANQALWSQEYRRPAAEAGPLQEQVAAHAADVLRCALVSRRPNAGPIDPDTLAIFLRACDQVQRFDGAQHDMIASAEEVTRRAPRFSRGWSMLAMANAYASRSAPPERRAGLRKAAAEAADRALALDASNEEALLARSVAMPLLGAWNERARLIDQAAALDPRSSQALLLRSELLSETGRMADALEQHEQALAIDPLAPNLWAGRLPLLGALGRVSELDAVHERLHRIWPNSPSALFNRFNNNVYRGRVTQALQMMDGGQVPENPLMRRYLEAAVRSDEAGRRAAAVAITDAARAGAYALPQAVALAATTGDVDTAFELANRISSDAGEVWVDQPSTGASRFFLFLISTENMRRDRRFLQLADRLGLLAHWRETGQWPDFCADPALPVPCRPGE